MTSTIASTRSSRCTQFARAAAPLAAIAFAAIILLHYPPDRYAFYPRCPIYLYLHLQCPGCGTTRALAALLHGHLHEALRLNALTTALLPVALLYIGSSLWRQSPIRWPQLNNKILYALFTLTILFTLARNLPI